MSQSIDLKHMQPKAALARVLSQVRAVKPYAGTLFFVLLGLMYGFILVRITILNNVQPDATSVNSQTSAAGVPKINSQAVRQLQSLEDNSVNVRTLFNTSRGNPFAE